MQLYKKPSVEVVLQNEAIANVFIVKNDGNDVKQEPYIYFITNLDQMDEAALQYRKRWKIEVFFKYMKTQGFNLEDFNMSGAHKVNILMSVLSLVLLIVIEAEKQQEEQQSQNGQIVTEKVCQYKNGKSYARKSRFRKGISAVTKIRVLEKFIDLCQIVAQKIKHNYQTLNELYILKKYAQ